MNCRDVMIEIAEDLHGRYKSRGYYSFSEEVEELRDRVRNEYLDRVREEMGNDYSSGVSRPRTLDMIMAVKIHAMHDAVSDNGFEFSCVDGVVHDPNDIIGRTLNWLKDIGLSYLVDHY